MSNEKKGWRVLGKLFGAGTEGSKLKTSGPMSAGKKVKKKKSVRSKCRDCGRDYMRDKVMGKREKIRVGETRTVRWQCGDHGYGSRDRVNQDSRTRKPPGDGQQ